VKALTRLLAVATVALLWLALPCRALSQTTLVIQPDPAAGEDTYIASASQVQNYGTQTQITSSSQSNSPVHPLVRFNLSGVPAGATVLSAIFEMYYFSSKVSVTESLNVHRALRSWTETGATWRTYDGANNWSSQGGDYDPAVIASASLTGTVNVWMQWNVTALVQGWVSGTIPNQGMLLESPPRSGNNDRQFYSSDFLLDPSLRPKLTLVYAASDLGASTKAVSSASAVTGQVLVYSIVVKNSGTLAATNVVVTDTVDTSRLGSIVPAQGGSLAGSTITWTKTATAALASVGPSPGGDVTLTFSARVLAAVPDGTVISNQAFLSSSTQAGIPSDDPSTPALDDPTQVTVREPAVTLIKRIVAINGIPPPDDPSNPPGVTGALTAAALPGDVMTYGVFFTNAGTGVASAFAARDGVPLHTDFLPDAFSPGHGIRLILGAATDLTNAADSDAGSFDPAASLNPDDPATPVNGLVTVLLGNVPAGTSGSFRFQVRVR
jgi:uncharacterized repeat protein (TIGR01451 family)